MAEYDEQVEPPARLVDDEVLKECVKRARRARLAQGLPEVIDDYSVLAKISGWLTEDIEANKSVMSSARDVA